jgi:hypothetical protein
MICLLFSFPDTLFTSHVSGVFHNQVLVPSLPLQTHDIKQCPLPSVDMSEHLCESGPLPSHLSLLAFLLSPPLLSPSTPPTDSTHHRAKGPELDSLFFCLHWHLPTT